MELCEEPDVTEDEGWEDDPDWQKALRDWYIACEEQGIDPRTGEAWR